MKALYQQAVFVTKQISGPSGNYNEPVTDGIGKSQVIEGLSSEKPCCNRTLFDSSVYNPYRDSYGRTYTGHWVIADTVEDLKTDVTNMLGLQTDEYAYFFSSHVHPFCERLELIDETSNESIFLAEIKNYTDKIGVASIPIKSTEEGIRFFKGHRYILKCRYNKKHSEKHTAMATMFIYFGEH